MIVKSRVFHSLTLSLGKYESASGRNSKEIPTGRIFTVVVKLFAYRMSLFQCLGYIPWRFLSVVTGWQHETAAVLLPTHPWCTSNVSLHPKDDSLDWDLVRCVLHWQNSLLFLPFLLSSYCWIKTADAIKKKSQPLIPTFFQLADLGIGGNFSSSHFGTLHLIQNTLKC